jgi:hypothetical protein
MARLCCAGPAAVLQQRLLHCDALPDIFFPSDLRCCCCMLCTGRLMCLGVASSLLLHRLVPAAVTMQLHAAVFCASQVCCAAVAWCAWAGCEPCCGFGGVRLLHQLALRVENYPKLIILYEPCHYGVMGGSTDNITALACCSSLRAVRPAVPC